MVRGGGGWMEGWERGVGLGGGFEAAGWRVAGLGGWRARRAGWRAGLDGWVAAWRAGNFKDSWMDGGLEWMDGVVG